jgi:hypothetical protein
MTTLIRSFFLLFCFQITFAGSWKKIDTLFTPSGVAALTFSAPVFCDFDHDGLPDLIVGNTSTGRINYYKNVGTPVKALYREDTSFVSSIYAGDVSHTNSAYPAVADLDGDNRVELIIGGFNGLLRYVNSGDSLHPIWTLDTTGLGFVNSLIGTDAWPAFADLDNDGDLDLIVGIGESFFGGPTAGITMGFRNIGTRTVPNFVLDNTLVTGIPDIGLNSYPVFADINNDGLVDLIFGRDTQTMLCYLNTGTKTSPVWTSTSGIVSGIEATTYWKVPSFVDIDGDGDLDLVYGTSDGTLFCYKNNGTKTSPVFQYDPSYFQVVRIDGGSATVSFADYDNDGDLDFISGDWLGKVQLFRNDGTKSAPRYTRVTTNYGGIDVGSYSSPVFVDIDGDGDPDIVSGDLNGNLHLYLNNNGMYSANTTTFASINVGGFSAPAFADLNGDGTPDLVLGAETADSMCAYINKGGTFIRCDSLIAGIEHFSNPHFAFVDIDKDGDFDLVIGTQSGAIAFYENIGTSSWPAWQRADGLFKNVSVQQNAAPAFADLDGDGKPDLVIGEYNGNFSCYKNMIPMTVAKNRMELPQTFVLEQNYPNPFNPATTISYSLPSSAHVTITIYSSIGREVARLADGFMEAGIHSLRWDAGAFSSGVYFCRVQADNACDVRRMLLLK